MCLFSQKLCNNEAEIQQIDAGQCCALCPGGDSPFIHREENVKGISRRGWGGQYCVVGLL
jgi:hypothetical protein